MTHRSPRPADLHAAREWDAQDARLSIRCSSKRLEAYKAAAKTESASLTDWVLAGLDMALEYSRKR